MFILVFYSTPITIRSMSLLIGVLHLHDDAIDKVRRSTERVISIRNRILNVMRSSRLIRGRPKPRVGADLIDKAIKSDIKVLEILAKIKDPTDKAKAKVIVTNEPGFETNRMTKSDLRSLLDSVGSKSQFHSLDKFMSRKVFSEYTSTRPADNQMWPFATTLVVTEDPDTDTITIGEFEEFMLRAVADVLNTAMEHDTPQHHLHSFKNQVLSLCPSLNEAKLQEAQTLARVKAIFSAIDRDRSGSIQRGELHKGLRVNYRVNLSRTDMHSIMRVIDPDQSGALTETEWLDFMMSTTDNLVAQNSAATKKEAAINAAKGHGLSTYAKEISVQLADTIGIPTSPENLKQLVAPLSDPSTFAQSLLGIPEQESGPRDDDNWEQDIVVTEQDLEMSQINPLATGQQTDGTETVSFT